MSVTVEKTFQGAWRVSDIVDYRLRTETYFGYTKREAIAEFKAMLRDEKLTTSNGFKGNQNENRH